MRFIAELLNQTSESILDYLNELPNRPEGLVCQPFRLKKGEPLMFVMFYYHKETNTVALVGIERHERNHIDYLADESPFNGEEVLYFSESDHYTSPLLRLNNLRKAVEEVLKKRFRPMNVWVMLVTNANIINKDEMEDSVWAADRNIVIDNVEGIEGFPAGSGSDRLRNLVFDIVNSDTFCTGFSLTPLIPIAHQEQETKKQDEKMKEGKSDLSTSHSAKQTDSLDSEEFERMLNEFINSEIENEDWEEKSPNLNPDDFDLYDGFGEEDEENEELEDADKKKGTSSADSSRPINEPPYMPQLEDGLRAEVHARMLDPETELEKMIGCEEIKKQIQQLTILTEYNKQLLKDNPNAKTHQVSLHAIFQGAPGTGKTTLCKIYSSLLYKAGVLSHGHVVVATRSTFMGTQWGSEETILHAVLNAASGGVLMVDEAYQLGGSGHPHDPCRNVLPMMMPMLADEHSRDIAVVLCGYKEPMAKLLELNQGLTSRFTKRFDFPDFTIAQLLEISKRKIADFKYRFTPKAWKLYGDLVTQAYEKRDPKTWGNARFVANLLEAIYIQHAQRCFKMEDSHQLHTITVADIKPVHLKGNEEKKRIIGFR